MSQYNLLSLSRPAGTLSPAAGGGEGRGEGARRFMGSLPCLVLILVACALLSLNMGHAASLGTAFTYQGRILDGGAAANGVYDLQFSLFDAASGGGPVGSALVRDDVAVTNGLFTVALDFGPGIFGGNALWLSMGVRPGASTGAYATLPVRQALSPAPTSQYALVAGTVLDGAITAGKIAPGAITTDKLPNFAVTVDKLASDAVITAKIQDNAVIAPKIASGQVVKSLNGLKDDVTLSTGSNLSLTTNGSTLEVGLNLSSLSTLSLNPDPNHTGLEVTGSSSYLPLTTFVMNSSGLAPPALMAVNQAGNANAGVLNVQNFGSGLLANFVVTNVSKATIAANGDFINAGKISSAGDVLAAGNLDGKNIPAIEWSEINISYGDSVDLTWPGAASLDNVSILVQSPGYLLISAFVQIRLTSPAIVGQLVLDDVTLVGSPVELVSVRTYGTGASSGQFPINLCWVLAVDSPKYVNLRTTLTTEGTVGDSLEYRSHNLTAVYIPKKSHE